MSPNCKLTLPISTQREVERASAGAPQPRPCRAVPADITLLLADIRELWACSVLTSGGSAQGTKLFQVLSLGQENILDISSYVSVRCSLSLCVCVLI